MSDGPAAGVEVASTTQQATGEQEQDQAAETGAGKTTFSGAGAKPPVAPTTKQAAVSASDQAFGESSELPTAVGNPGKRFRIALSKKDPAAITIAGESPALIGALITKEPALAAEYFSIVEANRSDAFRAPLKALFSHLSGPDKRKLFSAQFGFAIVDRPASFHDQAAAFQPDQVDKMYEAALILPPAHMTNNPRFKKLEAGNSARYIEKQDTIEMPGYAEASTGDKSALYGKAFRHEVGHAVDFALGDKTNKLRDEFGWHVVKEDDYEGLARHLEELGMMMPGLAGQERVDLARAIGGSIGLDDSFIMQMLVSFIGYKPADAKNLISRGVSPDWKKKRGAFFDGGVTIGDQQYFGCGFGMGGWAYRVTKATYDAAPPTGKVSHYEWFAEWYATYYATPEHAGVPGRLNDFFRDEVDPFNQQRSALGGADSKEGLGGDTPRFG